MEDSRIVELYWQRDETAIAETQNKYGHYCYSIANNILRNNEEAEECVNDTYLGAWKSIPPHCPVILSTFLGKITRQLSLKKLRYQTAGKRGGGAPVAALDELEECIPSGQSMEADLNARELAKIIDEFLGSLSTWERRVFLRRYWYFDSIKDISSRFGFSQSKVKMMLKRTRDKLLVRLGKEDIWV